MRAQITETQTLWAIIAGIICVDALWAWWLGIKIVVNPATIVAFCVMAGINLVYATIRPNRGIAVFAATTAQLIAFTASAAILSYLTVTSRFPLVDRYLAAADAAIGFNWLSLFMWVHERPAIGRVLQLSYDSGMFQIIILLMLLPALRQLERLREFGWLFVLTLLMATPIAWLFPAESAWAYFGVTNLTNAYHLADFTALRAGQMPEIIMSQVTGLVTFPSFHTELGLILIYVTRGIRILFPVSLGLNTLMIASTPSEGGHYLVDILAGLVLAPLAIAILRSWQFEESVRQVAAVDASPIRDEAMTDTKLGATEDLHGEPRGR